MIKNRYPGKFIVIEGLDGSGQTSQASFLKNFLLENNYSVISTKEPTQDSEAGKKIKKILEESIKIEPLELQRLFAEDRKWHLENIVIPSLKQRKIVISDRYCFSSFAYGAAEGIDLDKLIGLNKDFLLPDLTFILKVEPKICIRRIEKRGEPKTLFEKEEQLAKVWKIYEKFPKMFDNVAMIDGEKSIEKVFEKIKEIINLKIRKEEGS
jgi:dTMP kinase